MLKFIVLSFMAIFFISCNQHRKFENKAKITTCANTKTSDGEWYTLGKKAPLFNGLGGIDFKITTIAPEAQIYFNQGMMLAYGFNHAEAARSFFQATQLDSTCAMAYWGFAYVLGPNYNGGMEQDNFQRAYDAALKAKSLTKGCTPLETALIEALSSRYQSNPPADRSTLDIAYANAMKKVYEQFPTDPDIGALYADAMMNLHPWDLYDKTSGKPKNWTPELVSVLERLIKMNPKHPGAHHFYIHATEGSSNPEKALPSANLLNELVPGSGHLLHMPSHIYINTGDYHLGTLANLRAIAVDSVYTMTCSAQGVYPLAYYPHNYHFLTATAALEGNSSLSWTSAEKLQQHLATDLMDKPEWATLQHYYTIPYYIAVKFGMWDKILSLPKPRKDLQYPNAILHYARGLAYLSRNDMVHAQQESDTLSILASDSHLQELTVWNINSMADLAKIADRVLVAAIAFKQKNLEKSLSLLKDAIVLEDNLNYNEPPDWFFSVRHHLGAALQRAGKYAEAEKIYHQDLQKWKRNGWSLIGLYNTNLAQGKQKEAQDIKIAFDKAWKNADITITSSSNIF